MTTDSDRILKLAEIVREADGNHRPAAAVLAEAILSHHGSRWSPAVEPVPVSERLPGPEGPPLEPRGCPTPGACSCPTSPTVPPEPEGPTNEELEEFALEHGGGYFNCDCQVEADILTRKHVSNYRAVLARWGK